MNKHIFWIASYPKSGNTLLRAIVSSLFFSEDGCFDFKLLKKIPVIEDTANLEFIKSTNIDDYNNVHKIEILSKYWLYMQTKKNLNFKDDFMFVKTHHALIRYLENHFTTTNLTRGFIYIVRDPRDIVLSMSNYYDISIEKSIDRITNDDFSFKWLDTKNLFKNKEIPFSYISSWKNHYLSWNDHSFECPKLIISFEDLVYKKEKIINKIIKFFTDNYGFEFSNLDKKIPQIINQTSFNNLKKI